MDIELASQDSRETKKAKQLDYTQNKHRPIIPACTRRRQHYQKQGHSQLHNEFKSSLVSPKSLSQKKNHLNKNDQNRSKVHVKCHKPLLCMDRF